MKKVLLSILLLGFTVNLNAETNATFLYDGGENALLVDKKIFYVSVTDEVTGGCLPKPAKLKATMEKALKKHGFEISKDRKNPFIPEINIATLGFRINGMCAVEMSVDMYFPIQALIPMAANVPGGNKTYVTYTYDVGRYIGNYRRKQMQKKLQKISEKFADRIYMRISKAKDDIYLKFPSVEEEVKKNSK